MFTKTKGNGSVSSSSLPWYDGPYSVVPKVENQALYTKQMGMREDVSIAGIPKAEVSNIHGTTITIG